MLLAPAAWVVQGALGWYFGYEACTSFGVTGARTTLAVISVTALALACSGWFIAWSNWGRTTSERHPTQIDGWDRVEFMSAGGVLVSSVFAIGIVWATLGPALINACGGMR